MRFDPGQLFRTGFKSIISLFVGEQSDRRIIQALSSRRHEYYDYTIHFTEGRHGPAPRRDRVRDEVWLDFISDTGDGWNSTYAIAYGRSPSVAMLLPLSCLGPTCSCSAAIRSRRLRPAATPQNLVASTSIFQ
jgi:hypothetical protein